MGLVAWMSYLTGERFWDRRGEARAQKRRAKHPARLLLPFARNNGSRLGRRGCGALARWSSFAHFLRRRRLSGQLVPRKWGLDTFTRSKERLPCLLPKQVSRSTRVELCCRRSFEFFISSVTLSIVKLLATHRVSAHLRSFAMHPVLAATPIVIKGGLVSASEVHKGA